MQSAARTSHEESLEIAETDALLPNAVIAASSSFMEINPYLIHSS